MSSWSEAAPQEEVGPSLPTSPTAHRQWEGFFIMSKKFQFLWNQIDWNWNFRPSWSPGPTQPSQSPSSYSAQVQAQICKSNLHKKNDIWFALKSCRFAQELIWFALKRVSATLSTGHPQPVRCLLFPTQALTLLSHPGPGNSPGCCDFYIFQAFASSLTFPSSLPLPTSPSTKITFPPFSPPASFSTSW